MAAPGRRFPAEQREQARTLQPRAPPVAVARRAEGAARPAFVTMTGFHDRGPIAPYLTEDPRFSEFAPWLRYGNDSPRYHTQYQDIYVRRDLLPAVAARRRALEESGAHRDLEPAAQSFISSPSSGE